MQARPISRSDREPAPRLLPPQVRKGCRSRHGRLRERTEAMKIGEIMTGKACSCTTDCSLNDAAQIMWEHDCGCLPVFASGSDQRVVGVITDRDIAMAA